MLRSGEIHTALTDVSGSRDNRIKQMRALYQAFGPQIVDLRDMIRSGEYLEDPENYEEVTAALDAHVALFMEEVFSVNGECPVVSPQQLITDANNVREEVYGKLFPNGEENPALLNDIRFRPASIARGRIEPLFLSSDEVDARLQWEISNQLAVAYGVGVIRKRSEQLGLQEKADRINRALDSVWLGPRGTTTRKELFGLHDNVTNRIAFALPNDEFDFDPQQYHVKRHQYDFRVAKINGEQTFVYADVREKPIHTQYLKALREAKKNGGRINPNTGVRDSFGALFAVDGGWKETDAFAEQTFDAIHGVLPINRIVPDHNESAFFHRWNIYVAGWPDSAHLEAIYYPLMGHVNSKYEVRQLADDRDFTGRAHDLFSVRKYGDVAGDLLPPEYRDQLPTIMNQAYEAQGRNLLAKKVWRRS